MTSEKRIRKTDEMKCDVCEVTISDWAEEISDLLHKMSPIKYVCHDA